METKKNTRRFALLTPYSLDMIYETPFSITDLMIPKLLAHVIGSIVGLTLFIWFGLYVVLLLAVSLTPHDYLELFIKTDSPIHLIILSLAGYTVLARIEPLFQVLLLSALLMALVDVLSLMP
ncbi:hypothetical protein D3C85_860510 [compost metagenome]